MVERACVEQHVKDEIEETVACCTRVYSKK